VPANVTLSEADSKELLRRYGVPFATEEVVDDVTGAVRAAATIGFPVAVKASGPTIAHKTERGLVRLGLADADGVERAIAEIASALRPEDGMVRYLVARMIPGGRELIVGLIRDRIFGPVVMLGVGGILAEAISDVAFLRVPFGPEDIDRAIQRMSLHTLFDAYRGDTAPDRTALSTMLSGLAALAHDRPEVVSVDVNPVIVGRDGTLVAVDALVEVATAPETVGTTRRFPSSRPFDALFDPQGVVVVGASSHPGKFGFVSLHNILVSGYRGRVFGTNRGRERVLGIDCLGSVSEVPVGAADLAFLCTPASVNEDVLRQCADVGIRAVFVASAGYREAGDADAEVRLAALADELGLLMAGPNGQGLVSTPSRLCAQIVAPYPPAGSIGVASQSGNFVSTFMNYARHSGVGVSRAISAGNAAQTTMDDYLRYLAGDPFTSVGLTYLESVDDGPSFVGAVSEFVASKPLVMLKGGATSAGSRAASSHTGALAGDHAVFTSVVRQLGVTLVDDVEVAFDVAAAFATQPLPRGDRLVILTTVGGWGVVTADALARDGVLRLVDLPDGLMRDLDAILPPRWSRNNPIDCAGGETRDTVPEILDLVASCDEVDAVVLLGLGIQSNQARLMREGSFYPDEGLERIVAYHQRQDERYVRSALETSRRWHKPVMVATELAIADPANPGPATAREVGSYCFPTGARAVRALAEMVRYARFRRSAV
jgi:acetyltransferase